MTDVPKVLECPLVFSTGLKLWTVYFLGLEMDELLLILSESSALQKPTQTHASLTPSDTLRRPVHF